MSDDRYANRGAKLPGWRRKRVRHIRAMAGIPDICGYCSQPRSNHDPDCAVLSAHALAESAGLTDDDYPPAAWMSHAVAHRKHRKRDQDEAGYGR